VLGLLGTRRFLPLFVTQALGAANDNIFKNALVVLALYRLAHTGPIIVALAGGVFILPYALFSATAGQIADKFEKSRLIRIVKVWELGLMALATAGFLTGSVTALMLVLFGLGIQATFFSPLKYGILPDLLSERELIAGNGLIEAGTFLAILAGTIAGGALFLLPNGAAVSAAGLLVAAGGIFAAWFVPAVPAAAANLRIGWNFWRETAGLITAARNKKPVWLAILGISWFWAVGATLLAELPTIARDSLHAGGHVVTLMLACFSIGIGIGSILCAAILRGKISARFVPYAAIGISLFTFDFAHAATLGGALHTVPEILGSWTGRRIMADLLLLAACGGVYSVPLYVILQEKSAPSHRSRMIAANNVMNALAMTAAALFTAGLYAALPSAPLILAVTAIINLAVAIWIIFVLKILHE
jgi:acyl-[acyl-carrier-protein]-phospholipid O-acyltransferase/long-chain-fatty-acid--[acyl-carrier-protein] ligase